MTDIDHITFYQIFLCNVPLLRTIMNNLSDVCYVFQLIVHQIFVYLRDFILNEFSRFTVESQDVEGSTKSQGSLSRHALADFVAFFTLCGFLGIFVLISAKSSKDDEEFVTSTISTTSRNMKKPQELPKDASYVIPPKLASASSSYCRASGDICFPNDPCTRNGYKYDVSVITCPRNANLTRSQFVAAIRNQSKFTRHSQSTQTDERTFKRVACVQDWMIRKTRSGHVYGKYPI
ncbi:uncharacterized protein LOC112494058 isoform X1 [Cephus cinctus]|uniref:Uncharacterized protein LOC112494058 isoform X1 n=1 Tax=Cephus cinctus TaxID=211228 RepID=A0AAJ7RDP3_CEPCN|nr:uncharacterized protein LOC112494058 isoform X1 [Cephus cinctus]